VTEDARLFSKVTEDARLLKGMGDTRLFLLSGDDDDARF
jgi:hypothetical protein